MLDRREFLKKAAKMAGGGAFGLAAMHSFGMGAVKDAMGHGILPAVVGSGGATPWGTWLERDEYGWGDQVNTFIALYENTSASGNETGQGAGLTGADLVVTQVGGVAGATGSPPSRLLDGIDDEFIGTTPLFDLISRPTWTILTKFGDIADSGNVKPLFTWNSAGNAQQIWANKHSDNTAQVDFRVALGSDSPWVGGTSAAIPATGPVYFAIWADGVNKVRMGFLATKPTKWSDFPANQRFETIYTGDFTGVSFTETYYRAIIGRTNGENTAAKVYYTIISKSAFISAS